MTFFPSTYFPTNTNVVAPTTTFQAELGIGYGTGHICSLITTPYKPIDGVFRQPYKLQLLLAHSAKMRELLGVSSVDEALDKIAYRELDPRNDQPPFCWVYDDHERSVYERRKVSHGSNLWVTEGSLFFTIITRIPVGIVRTFPTSPQEHMFWLMNEVGVMITEIEALSGLGNPIGQEAHINITNHRPSQGPFEIDAIENGIIGHDDTITDGFDPDNHVYYAVTFEVSF